NAVGIYVNKSGVVSRVADPTVNVPNTGSRFVQFYDQRVTNGVVTFAASGQNNTGGIYRWNDGTITTYLDTSLRMPDGTNHFTGLGTFSEQGSDIAFGGAGADPLSRGIYALVNGSVSLIADVRTRGIGTDRNIEGFSNPALYNGNIVFLDNHDYVLYDKSVDGALRRIIGMGDVLGGKRID
ncbi:MAG: hypothetical protein JNM07_15440, partial [Phycisphaerae bacterium]|nr:hypothetical protein [Phycisphaerae bacterium]